MTSSPSSSGRYVPPHLRNRPVSSSDNAGPSTRTPHLAPTHSQPPQSRTYRSEPTRGSRTPWSTKSSNTTPDTSTDRSNTRDARTRGPSPPNSAPAPRSNRGPSSSSPTLYIFGDSFVGPMKLLSEENVQIRTFKGASAKGLNNPKSLKQVSKDLLPALNGLLAPPPYVYTPSAGRWAFLVFGNVDLQINYLYQLQHKPITELSFLGSTDSEGAIEEEEDDTAGPSPNTRRPSASVLASATETSLSGPALGPDLFVDVVLKAYTAWLEREIVNGPVGQRLGEAAEERRAIEQGKAIRGRRKPPGKVLVAAALPPLVEDETLYRIPEKYVERLEEDHAKAQKAMSDPAPGSRAPWAPGGSSIGPSDPLEDGVSTLALTDAQVPPSPTSSASASSKVSSLFDPPSLHSSLDSSLAIPSSPADDLKKTSIQDLLAHDPPLCTLPVRVRMTERFNEGLAAFCARYPDVLALVDISPSVLSSPPHDTIAGAANRDAWACPVDPTNIHPLWEPTLPLWLEELEKQGVPTAEYEVTEDAKETFKAYEEDKRRRTATQPWGEADWAMRVKLRDE
ncbi:hypothetical protein BCR39DRAFT_493062 [Naematelia encephala]|uniref:Uncharacterized protein n=1 Tax=Naematelia encephala TaxID=71784 RepID=A0A1Y2BBD1_9TREE|nr:hypothetical protein BCR39DRAFT_493062 [Naematelia encephala]